MSTRLLSVAQRDGWTCWLCGDTVDPDATGTPWAASVDHVVPRALGGVSTADNLRLAHRRCNSRRGSRLPELRWPSRFGVVHDAPLWQALQRAARRPGEEETVAVLTSPERAREAADWLVERAELLLGAAWAADLQPLPAGLAALRLRRRADGPGVASRLAPRRRRRR